jgi:Spy/CpxP family protein refolding chaperone
MKKKFAISSLLLAAILMATNAVAQKGGGGGGGGGGNKSGGSKNSGSKDQKTADTSNAELEDLTSKLTLTDPQKAQVKSILDGRDSQLAALKKEKLPKDESKSKSKEIKDTANDKIRAILTPDQQKIFDKTVKKGNKNKDKAPTPTATPAAAAGPPTP